MPVLTVLNFSAGRQSTRILQGVLRGEIAQPEHFLVVRANPGMENSDGVRYAVALEAEARAAGITCIVAPGPNLFTDLVQIGSRTRIDNPPYWTPARSTKSSTRIEKPTGRLAQKCTKKYKVAPMDCVVRDVLTERFGFSRVTRRLPAGCVEKWIGFTTDEAHRVSASRTKYATFRYPLIEMGESKVDVLRWYETRGVPMPPPSHCNACFSQGLRALKEMHDERPEDWAQAVAVDDAVRDMRHCGVDRPVFVSRTLVPLRELAARDFQLDNEIESDVYGCNSGACFL